MVYDNCITEKMMKDSLRNYERGPARGETRKCMSSMDEMLNFTSPMLGLKVVLHKILNVKRSDKYVMMGRVSRLHGGNVTESITCHQQMFPFMLM
jgi:ribosomal protein L35AE/L33A